MSEECIKSDLDLFTVPMTQTSIEKNTYVEIPPLSAITDSSPISFFIAGMGEDYIDLDVHQDQGFFICHIINYTGYNQK